MLVNFNQNNYFLIKIILFSFFLRLLFLFFIDADFLNFSDQTEYRKISDFILEGNLLSAYFLQRTPIYPLFIALIRYFIDNYFLVIIVQNLIGIGLVYLSYLISIEHFYKYFKYITVLMSINLNILLHNQLLLTETIFLLFFYLFILNLFNYLKFKKIKNVIYLSIFLGLCTLTRPVTIYLPFFLIAIFFLNYKNFKSFIYHTFLMLIIFQTVIGFWQMRNYNLYKNFNLVTNKEVNLVGYYLPHFDQYEYSFSLEEAKIRSRNNFQRYLNKNLTEKTIEDPFEREKIAIQFSKDQVKNYSLNTLFNGFFWGSIKNIFAPSFSDFAYWFKLKKLSFSKTEGSSFPEQLKNFARSNYGSMYLYLLILSGLLTLILRIFSVYGVFFSFRENRIVTMTIIILISYFLIIMGPIGHSKYRIPIELFLNIFLAIGLKKILYKIKHV